MSILNDVYFILCTVFLNEPFLGAFAYKLPIAATSLVVSVRPCLGARNNANVTEWIFVKFLIIIIIIIIIIINCNWAVARWQWLFHM